VALATTHAQHIELADEIAEYSCAVAGHPGFTVTFVTPAVTPVEVIHFQQSKRSLRERSY